MPYPFPLPPMGSLPLFTVGASPSAAAASRPYDGTPEVTNSVTVSQASGLPSTLSGVWSHVSGDASIVVNSPSLLTTTFQGTPAENTTTSAVKRCTVTNGFGQVDHVDVTVTITAENAVLHVTTTPESSVFLTLAGGAGYDQGVTCAATGGDGGPYTFAWNMTSGGSLSGFSGTSNNVHVDAQAAGNTLLMTLTVRAFDSHSHTGVTNLNFHINWV